MIHLSHAVRCVVSLHSLHWHVLPQDPDDDANLSSALISLLDNPLRCAVIASRFNPISTSRTRTLLAQDLYSALLLSALIKTLITPSALPDSGTTCSPVFVSLILTLESHNQATAYLQCIHNATVRTLPCVQRVLSFYVLLRLNPRPESSFSKIKTLYLVYLHSSSICTRPESIRPSPASN